jgi:hypothetical protein
VKSRRTSGESSASTSRARRADEASRLLGRGREIVLVGGVSQGMCAGKIEPTGSKEIRSWWFEWQPY